MLRALLISTVCGLASWGVATAQIPSEAEIRAQMEAAGMTPAQIDEVLRSMLSIDPEVLSGEGDAADRSSCEDANDNEICDDEENDPEITSCRVSYLDAITKYATDRYGTRLGDDSIGISLTCQAASGGEFRSLSISGISEALGEIESINEYWSTVLRHGVYLRPDLRRRYERIHDAPEANLSQMSSDLRPLAIISFQLDNQKAHLSETEKKAHNQLLRRYVDTAKPIHRRCESIRRSVGASFRAQFVDNAVCLRSVPTADEASEGED